MQSTLKSKKEISGNGCGSRSYCIYEMLFIRSPVVYTEAAESWTDNLNILRKYTSNVGLATIGNISR